MKKFIVLLLCLIVVPGAYPRNYEKSNDVFDRKIRGEFTMSLGANWVTNLEDYKAPFAFGLGLGMSAKVSPDLRLSTSLNLVTHQYGIWAWEIPVFVRFYFARRWSFDAGISAAFLTQGEDADIYYDDLNKTQLAIPFGISYMSKSGFGLSVNYTRGVSNYLKYAERMRRSAITLSMIVVF